MKMRDRIHEVERICEHKFERQELAEAALTHPSAVEGKPVSASYERLEFLGDSILGAVVAYDMYTRFPGMDEGKLSRLKTALISGNTLSDVASELGIAPLIWLGSSERGAGARGMHSALENVYEAIVGALYLDGGVEAARSFIERTLLPRVSPDMASRPLSPKSRLQEVTQRDLRCGPVYKLVGEEGPMHSPTFTSVAIVGGRRVGRGKGSSKKEAEAAAALDALANLGYLSQTGPADASGGQA